MRTPRARQAAPAAPASALPILAVCIVALLAATPLSVLGGGDPAKFLETLRTKRQADAKASAGEFDRLVSQARLLLQQRAYVQARTLLARAHTLRPDDKACAALLAEANAGAGKLKDPKAVLEAARDGKAAREDTHQRLLEHDLFNAQQALRDGKPDVARDHAARVLAGADYVGDAAKAADLRTRAKAVIASAGEAATDGRAKQQARDLALARERAVQDRDGEISKLCARGWRLHQKGDLDKALELAEQMFKLDPTSKKALYLHQQTQAAIDKSNDHNAIRAERNAAAKDTLMVELSKELDIPKDIKARIMLPGEKGLPDDVAPVAFARPMEAWEQRIRARLREPVTVEFEKATVSEACHQLSQLTGCNILVDPSAVRAAQQFSLPKMTVSFDHVLKWLCRFNKVTYTVRDHAVLITSRGGGRLNRPVTRDYDIHGLLIPTRAVKTTFEGSIQVDGHTLKAAMVPELPKDGGKEPEFPKDKVGKGWAEFIRATIAPDTWGRPAKGMVAQEAPRYSIQYRNGRIVVVHTPEVQREIEEMLNNFRRARNLQVHVFTRFLQIEMDFLVNMDIDWGDGQGALGPFPGLIDSSDPSTSHSWDLFAEVINNDEIAQLEQSVSTSGGLQMAISCFDGPREVNAFLQAVAKHRKGTLLIAPRLTCFNTQRANFQAVTNFNYVRTVSADNEPEIGNIPDGIIFDVQPFVSADHRYITLVLQPQLRTLISLVEFQYVGGGIRERFIQIPTTELRSIATTVTIPDGGTVLTGGLAKVDEARGVASVPFIHSIPCLKHLFRSWTEAERRTSLVILASAQIVPDIFEDE